MPTAFLPLPPTLSRLFQTVRFVSPILSVPLGLQVRIYALHGIINTSENFSKDEIQKRNNKSFRTKQFDARRENYRKHNEAARLSACLLLGMVSMIIFFFFSIFFNKALTDDWFSLKNFTPIQIQSIFVGVGILCFIALFLRYTRKRTAAILLKYKGNMWNKIIPAWMIYCSPLL